MSSYFLSLGTSVAVFAILAVSLSLLIGHLGIFSMAHGALFGVGAYAFAYLNVTREWGFWPAAAVAVLVTAAAGLLLAIPTLRVSGDYFIVASFALQIVASSVFGNWDAVTGGTNGIPGVLRPDFGGVDFYSDGNFLIYAAVVMVAVTLLASWLVRSPYGRMLHLIRDDAVVAETMGKPVASTKAVVTVVAAGFAGAAGVIYAQYLMYISPGSFDVNASISVITMVVIGGMTSVWGAVLGSALIMAIPQALQNLSISSSVAGPLEQVLFGALLMLIMFLRPQGIIGDRPRKRPRRTPAGSTSGEQLPTGKEAVNHAS